MTLSDDVNLEEFVMTKDEFSGADIKAICTEAGLLALRERRMKVSFLFAYDICLITWCDQNCGSELRLHLM
jgi:ATP-dependent 26S proteasome regulatory subunit